jgi:hypothetical protein
MLRRVVLFGWFQIVWFQTKSGDAANGNSRYSAKDTPVQDSGRRGVVVLSVGVESGCRCCQGAECLLFTEGTVQKSRCPGHVQQHSPSQSWYGSPAEHGSVPDLKCGSSESAVHPRVHRCASCSCKRTHARLPLIDGACWLVKGMVRHRLNTSINACPPTIAPP